MARHLVAYHINIVLQIHLDCFGCECSPRSSKATERTLITKGGEKSAKGQYLVKHGKEPHKALCYAWFHCRMRPLAHIFCSRLGKGGGEGGASLAVSVCQEGKAPRHRLTRERRGETPGLKLKFCPTLVLNFPLFCHEAIKWGLILRNCFSFTPFFFRACICTCHISRGPVNGKFN